MPIFHRHKWSEPKDRYQTCIGCGLARVVECAHQWKTIADIRGQYVWGGGDAHRIEQQCERCGEVRRVDLA